MLPYDEHAVESVFNNSLRRAGFWVKHIDETGFPDTVYTSREHGTGFIEYKYLRPSTLKRPMINRFTNNQPGAFASMLEHGAKITLLAYFDEHIYSELLTPEKLLAFKTMTAAAWLHGANFWGWATVEDCAGEFLK